MAQALDFCHTLGIAHRDIKPENLLLFRSGSRSCFKLADFGAAALTKHQPTLPPAGARPALRRMVSSRPIGSTQFVPPEVANLIYSHKHKRPRPDIKYDAYAVDAWSYGVALFHMAAGREPFNFAHWSDKQYVAFCTTTGQFCAREEAVTTDSSVSTVSSASTWVWPPTFEHHLINLIESCMQVESTLRPSMHDICRHVWFRGSVSASIELETTVTATTGASEEATSPLSATRQTTVATQAEQHDALAWLEEDSDVEVIRVADSPADSQDNAAPANLFSAKQAANTITAAAASGGSPLHPALQMAMAQASRARVESTSQQQRNCHSLSQVSMLRTNSAMSPGGSFISTGSSRLSSFSAMTGAMGSFRSSARASSASSGHSLLRHHSIRNSHASCGSIVEAHAMLPPIASSEREDRLSKEDAVSSEGASSASPQFRPRENLHSELPSLPPLAVSKQPTLSGQSASLAAAHQPQHSSATTMVGFGPVAGSPDSAHPKPTSMPAPTDPAVPRTKSMGFLKKIFKWS